MQNSDKKSTMDEQEKSGQPNVLTLPPSTDGSVGDLNVLMSSVDSKPTMAPMTGPLSPLQPLQIPSHPVVPVVYHPVQYQSLSYVPHIVHSEEIMSSKPTLWVPLIIYLKVTLKVRHIFLSSLQKLQK